MPDPRPVAREGEVHDPAADRGEVVAARRAQRREQADRREARDRVDLGHDERLAGEQEVDPGEALGADRAVGVAGELEHRRPLDRRDLGRERRLRQAGRVLRRVVVELVAGHDLARAVQLELVGLVAEDGHLEVPGAGEVALDEREVVEAERLVEGRRPLRRGVGEGHPDRAAEPRRLDHEPRVAAPGRERLELGEHAVRVGGPAGGADLDPVRDGQAEAADEPLEHGLVHADRAGGHAGARVGEPGRLAQGLRRAVLAERAVEREEDDRPGLARREPLEGLAGVERPRRAERGRVVVGGLRPAVAPEAVRAAATSRRRGRSARSPPGYPDAARASAIADPDTIDTSCSADGPPRTTATGVAAGSWASGGTLTSWSTRASGGLLGRRCRPVADELDLEREVDAVVGPDLARARAPPAGGRRRRSRARR